MKKSLVVLLILGLVASFAVAPAQAGKKKKKQPVKTTRVVESVYEAPALGIAPPGSGVCLRPTNSCGDIATGGTEKYVTIEILDTTGTPVAFSLGQDTDPETFGTESDLGNFCGTTGDQPIEIEPGLPLVVFPWAIGVECKAIATQGTVKATLSNLP